MKATRIPFNLLSLESIATEPVTAKANISERTAVMEQQLSEFHIADTAVDTESNRGQDLYAVADTLKDIVNTVVDGDLHPEDADEHSVSIVRTVATQALSSVGQKLAAIPSMESESTPDARVRLTMESIKESLAKVWELIKKAAVAFLEAIERMFENYLGVLTTTRTLVDEMSSKLDDLSWGQVNAGIPFSQTPALMVEGRLDPTWYNSVLNSLVVVQRADTKLIGRLRTVSADIQKDILEGLKDKSFGSSDESEAKLAATLSDVFKFISDETLSISNHRKSSFQDETGSITKSGILPGEYTITSVSPKADLPPKEYIPKAVSYIYHGGKLQVEVRHAVTELNVPNQAELRKAVLQLSELVDDIITTQTKERQKDITAAKATVKAVENAINRHLDIDAEIPRDVLRIAAANASVVVSGTRPFYKYITVAMPVYVKALAACMKAYA